MIFELSNSKEKKVTPTFYVGKYGDLEVHLNGVRVLIIKKDGTIELLLFPKDYLKSMDLHITYVLESATFPGHVKLRAE